MAKTNAERQADYRRRRNGGLAVLREIDGLLQPWRDEEAESATSTLLEIDGLLRAYFDQ